MLKEIEMRREYKFYSRKVEEQIREYKRRVHVEFIRKLSEKFIENKVKREREV